MDKIFSRGQSKLLILAINQRAFFENSKLTVRIKIRDAVQI